MSVLKNQNEQLWTDKYKPMKIPDIVGNKSNIQKIINWLRDWNDIHIFHKKEKPKFVKFGDNIGAKAILLSGPPGIGKTSMAHIIANDLGFDIQELNSSDDRTKNIIEREVKETNSMNTVLKYFKSSNTAPLKRYKVIIMDEVDGLSSSDRGGVTALIDSIKNTKTPIICICNDRYKPTLKSLINHCLDIKINRPDKREIMKRMWYIINEENWEIDLQVIEKMVESSGNDIRSVINNLQFMHYGRDHSISTNKKEESISIFESSRLILSPNTNIQTKYNLYFNDCDITPLFIQENYIKTSNDIDKLALSSEILSDLDYIDSFSTKNTGIRDWGILPVGASLAAAVGCLSDTSLSFPDFPQYLGKNSTKRKRDRYLMEMTTTNKKMHKKGNRILTKDFRLDYIPLYQINITKPLINGSSIPDKNKKELISQFINTLDENGMEKEDIVEKIPEFYLGDINKEYIYENIDSKLKTALTREWNKIHSKSSKSIKSTKSTIMTENDNYDTDSSLSEDDTFMGES